MLSDKIKPIVDNYGSELINQIIAQLQAANKYSDRLAASLNKELSENGGDIGLAIEGDAALQYIETGRRPGKQPPGSALQGWMAAKGIPVNESTTYLVARHIGRFGIPPTYFLEKALALTDNKRDQEIIEAVLEYIKDKLNTR